MPKRVPPLAIGSDTWPGAAKLMEEAGELVQVLGKLAAFPDCDHPDGSDLRERLTEEAGDVLAALDYFILANTLSRIEIDDRRLAKADVFRKWHFEEHSGRAQGERGSE